MGLRLRPYRGSHLPVLMKAVAETEGPILELGCGLYSTNPLHWACWVPKRKLVTYENKPEFYEFLKQYETDFHEVHCIDDWETIDISGPWSVAFIDHDPGKGKLRWKEAARAQHAELLVVHDSEPRNDHKYGFSNLTPLFKYQFSFTETWPQTTIFSNTHDVTDFLGEHRRTRRRRR